MPPLVVKKKKELEKLTRECDQTSKAVQQMRARLDNSYNIKRIMDLENEHLHLKNSLKEEDKRAVEIK